MAAKNSSKSADKGATDSQKNPVSSKSASKAAKPSSTAKKTSSEAAPHDTAETGAPQKLSQKTAAKTQQMTSKQHEPQADTPTPSETPKPASKKASASKQVSAKFPKGIFSPATGTATTDPFPQKDLEKFRTLIQELRVDNQEELEVLTEQLREMTSSENMDDNSAYSLHMAEQGTDAMEREKTFLQAQRTSDYIKKLDEALRRIQDSTFGICRICSLRLDPKRMMAVPVTQVCTYYKNTAKPCEPGRIQMQAAGMMEDEG